MSEQNEKPKIRVFYSEGELITLSSDVILKNQNWELRKVLQLKQELNICEMYKKFCIEFPDDTHKMFMFNEYISNNIKHVVIDVHRVNFSDKDIPELEKCKNLECTNKKRNYKIDYDVEFWR